MLIGGEEYVEKEVMESAAVKEREPELIVYKNGTMQGKKLLVTFKAEALFNLGSSTLLINIEFPIVIDKEVEEEKKKEKIAHPRIEGAILTDFIMILHGSYWPIWKIRDAFHKQHPEISSRIIKKKVPTIAQKEKGAQDPKVFFFDNL